MLAGKARFMLPERLQCHEYFMLNRSTVFSYALIRDFEASRVTTPETTFESYVNHWNLSRGSTTRLDAGTVSGYYAWFSSSKVTESAGPGQKGTGRFFIGVKPFSGAWRKAYMLRIMNEFYPEHECATSTPIV